MYALKLDFVVVVFLTEQRKKNIENRIMLSKCFE